MCLKHKIVLQTKLNSLPGLPSLILTYEIKTSSVIGICTNKRRFTNGSLTNKNVGVGNVADQKSFDVSSNSPNTRALQTCYDDISP